MTRTLEETMIVMYGNAMKMARRDPSNVVRRCEASVFSDHITLMYFPGDAVAAFECFNRPGTTPEIRYSYTVDGEIESHNLMMGDLETGLTLFEGLIKQAGWK